MRFLLRPRYQTIRFCSDGREFPSCQMYQSPALELIHKQLDDLVSLGISQHVLRNSNYCRRLSIARLCKLVLILCLLSCVSAIRVHIIEQTYKRTQCKTLPLCFKDISFSSRRRHSSKASLNIFFYVFWSIHMPSQCIIMGFKKSTFSVRVFVACKYKMLSPIIIWSLQLFIPL